MFRASTTIARAARAATGRRTMASSSGLPLPSISTVVLTTGTLGAAGYWAYERQQEKLHQSAIIWHGADRGARPPTEQVFFPPEERGEMPQWKRIWRTTTPSGFNREGDTELVAEEGQQPTV